jgi:hypothetical protein
MRWCGRFMVCRWMDDDVGCNGHVRDDVWERAAFGAIRQGLGLALPKRTVGEGKGRKRDVEL